MPEDYDAVIVGGGHNGLVSAAYLAKAGVKTLVLERRKIVGGACVTEEPWPGYRVNSVAYAAGLLRPKIIEDLGLKKFGLEVHVWSPQYFLPFPDGNHIFLWDDPKKTIKEIERFSSKDAKAYLEFEKFWQEFYELVDIMLLSPPPKLADLVNLMEGPEAEELLRRILLMSGKQLLDEWFESEYVKAAFISPAVLATFAGPMTPGTAYLIGHYAAGCIDEMKQVWGWARGGIGSIPDSIARAAKYYGAEILTRAEVEKIIVKEGQATGVALVDGRTISAKKILSNADPQRTFFRLVGTEHLDPEFAKKIEKLKVQGCTLKVNCAINELPDFNAYRGREVGPQHSGTIDICPSVEYLERAFDDAKYGWPSKKPFVEMTIQSAYDQSVAPPGKHVITMLCQYYPYKLREGDWDAVADEAGDRVVETVTDYAPNLKEAIIHRQVITPKDMENEYFLPQGNASHADNTPDQVFSFRPVPGWANYRTPIANLYLCGAGTHPGGGILGAPGHNAAMAVLEDFKEKL